MEGEDPRNTELIWDQMFRATVNYGRKGLPIQAISAVDLAIWDLLVGWGTSKRKKERKKDKERKKEEKRRKRPPATDKQRPAGGETQKGLHLSWMPVWTCCSKQNAEF